MTIETVFEQLTSASRENSLPLFVRHNGQLRQIGVLTDDYARLFRNFTTSSDLIKITDDGAVLLHYHDAQTYGYKQRLAKLLGQLEKKGCLPSTKGDNRTAILRTFDGLEITDIPLPYTKPMGVEMNGVHMVLYRVNPETGKREYLIGHRKNTDYYDGKLDIAFARSVLARQLRDVMGNFLDYVRKVLPDDYPGLSFDRIKLQPGIRLAYRQTVGAPNKPNVIQNDDVYSWTGEIPWDADLSRFSGKHEAVEFITAEEILKIMKETPKAFKENVAIMLLAEFCNDPHVSNELKKEIYGYLKKYDVLRPDPLLVTERPDIEMAIDRGVFAGRPAGSLKLLKPVTVRDEAGKPIDVPRDSQDLYENAAYYEGLYGKGTFVVLSRLEKGKVQPGEGYGSLEGGAVRLADEVLFVPNPAITRTEAQRAALNELIELRKRQPNVATKFPTRGELEKLDDSLLPISSGTFLFADDKAVLMQRTGGQVGGCLYGCQYADSQPR